MSPGDLQWSVTSRCSGFAYRKRGRNEDTKRKLFCVPISPKYKHRCTRHVKKIKKNAETRGALKNKEMESRNTQN